MDKELAQKLLEKVKQDYSLGSEVFSRRSKLWSETVDLVRLNVKKGERVLDVGCGDGRWFEILKERGVEYVGVDNCGELIKVARQKFQNPNDKFQTNLKSQIPKFQTADILNLPFGDNEFSVKGGLTPGWDVVLCIAVLHHIPSRELQLKALGEMHRVLRTGGRLVMTNWNLTREVWKPKHIALWLYGFMALKRERMGFRDLLVPWSITGDKIKRYYHAFSLAELGRLVKKVGFKIDTKYYGFKGERASCWRGRNMVVVGEKK